MSILRSLAPFILYTVLAPLISPIGAAVVALALTVVLLAVARRRGVTVDRQVIEVSSLTYFAVYAVILLLFPHSDTGRWTGAAIQLWLGITVIATVIVHKPFTLPIAGPAPRAPVGHPGIPALQHGHQQRLGGQLHRERRDRRRPRRARERPHPRGDRHHGARHRGSGALHQPAGEQDARRHGDRRSAGVNATCDALGGNRAPVASETTATDLAVTGALPPELAGHYLRNGPNPRTTSDHWFTGDGMVHGVRLVHGVAQWYRNRYVHTDSFSDPFPLYGPDGSRNLHSSVANTHVIRHADKILALVESSLPYEITAGLDTIGCHDFGGSLDNSMTAHPKICPTAGEMHFFGYGSLREPHVRYHRADADGNLILDQPIEVPGLTMMHDFALTAQHVVFLDLPVLFDLALAQTGADMPYRWQPTYGARLGVLRRDTPTAPVRWFDIDPCYVFHVANAHDERSDEPGSDRIVLTAARYPSMWADAEPNAAVMWEWTLDLATGQARERQLDDAPCEFPRIDDRRTGLPTAHAYVVTDHAVRRYELSTGATQTHDFGEGSPGEMTFVPRRPPDQQSSPESDTDGFLMGYVHRPSSRTSDLVVLS